MWAVGGQTKAGTTTAVPIVEHFDGIAWKAVTDLPDVGNAKLIGVYAPGPGDVRALTQLPAQTNTVLHWDGTSWSTTTPGERRFTVTAAGHTDKTSTTTITEDQTTRLDFPLTSAGS